MQLTTRAAERVQAIRDRESIPGDASLRIARSGDDDGGLSIGFVAQPAAQDEVAEAHGLRYCVEQEIAPALDSAVLDVGDGGEPPFVLRRNGNADDGLSG